MNGIYLDREARLQSIRDAAERAKQRQPCVRRVILFGSLATGIPTPFSDADLLIVVSESDLPDPQARIPAALTWFGPLPCPMDVVVLTEEEFKFLEKSGSPLLREVCGKGIDL